mmetsp:Transcript_15189/g.57320  ORF Transcript_15189/g.57320 Transcript_15189/m.57320 type:complete len:303 (+) Transcript_15189:1033-1941(+)
MAVATTSGAVKRDRVSGAERSLEAASGPGMMRGVNTRGKDWEGSGAAAPGRCGSRLPAVEAGAAPGALAAAVSAASASAASAAAAAAAAGREVDGRLSCGSDAAPESALSVVRASNMTPSSVVVARALLPASLASTSDRSLSGFATESFVRRRWNASSALPAHGMGSGAWNAMPSTVSVPVLSKSASVASRMVSRTCSCLTDTPGKSPWHTCSHIPTAILARTGTSPLFMTSWPARNPSAAASVTSSPRMKVPEAQPCSETATTSSVCMSVTSLTVESQADGSGSLALRSVGLNRAGIPAST